MKKFIKLPGIAVLVTAMVFSFTSCEGPAGPAGKDGLENTFTVTFVFDNGSPDRTVRVISGGEVREPANPVKPLTPAEWNANFLSLDAGLYNVTSAPTEYSFSGWRNGNVPFDFDSTITANLTLTAQWSIPAAGKVDEVAANALTATFDHINENPGEYLMLVDAPVSATGNKVINTASHLTIVGKGQERVITLTANHNRFALNTNADAKLTIGNNITLTNTASGNAWPLVNVTLGTFTMEAGSKITGYSTSDFFGAMLVSANGTFIMNGGTITSNASTNTSTAATGGVYVNGGTFTMNGGTITGNTANSANFDVYAVQETRGKLTLSGAATIGTIMLNANITNAADIILGSNYNPASNATLHLRVNSTSMETVISRYIDKDIFKSASGTITAADVAKFTLGNFYGDTVAVTQPISDTHTIDSTGKLVVKP